MTTSNFSLAGKRVWVAGHLGMVGSALVRRLQSENCTLLTVDRQTLDLRRQSAVEGWLKAHAPEVIFVAAATVGGILANSARPAEFLYDNLTIGSNIIHGAAASGVSKLMYLGAACVYPRLAPQPIPESSILQGPPEPTNEFYTVAKIAGLKLCESYRRQRGCDFIGVVPANLYGPRDRFDPESGHVVPSLMLRAHRARLAGDPELSIWGTGQALREFMYIDDCADALVFLMKTYSEAQIINVGTGEEVSIGGLARGVCDAVGYTGQLTFDTSKPDGMPRKLLDSTRMLSFGWRPQVPLATGLRRTYEWLLANQPQAALPA